MRFDALRDELDIKADYSVRASYVWPTIISSSLASSHECQRHFLYIFIKVIALHSRQYWPHDGRKCYRKQEAQEFISILDE